MLTVTSTAIDAVKVVTPKLIADSRGAFCETYNQERFAEHGIMPNFVQDNQSVSAAIGTIRGLHFQGHPAAQAKLVRVLKGRIFDVAVDLRRSSPTYGKWVAEEVSAENRKQVFIPIGFAHGFCTLEIDTHVFYKVSAFYSPRTISASRGTIPIWRLIGLSRRARRCYPTKIAGCRNSSRCQDILSKSNAYRGHRQVWPNRAIVSRAWAQLQHGSADAGTAGGRPDATVRSHGCSRRIATTSCG